MSDEVVAVVHQISDEKMQEIESKLNEVSGRVLEVTFPDKRIKGDVIQQLIIDINQLLGLLPSDDVPTSDEGADKE